MSRLAATLRIARRDARRARGRSALVVAMIALPVLGVGTADVLWRTYELSADQQATRTMGAADLRLQDSGLDRITQRGATTDEARPRTAAPPDPLDVLPAGSRVVTDRAIGGDGIVPGRRAYAELRELDLTDPLTAGLFTVRAGAVRPGPGEAVLTDRLADRLGVAIGDTVELQPRRVDPHVTSTVVGLVRSTSTSRSETAFLSPGSLAGIPTGLDLGKVRVEHLVDLPGAVSWDDVARANAAGWYVEGRAPIPGAPPVEEFEGTGEIELAAIIGLVVGMALLEVVLLAGPAFAVGTKRQSRELALLAATGGDRSDVRRTVLSSGVVLGALGGVVGVGAAVALGAVAVPLVARFSGDLPGPFDVRPLELLLLAAVGTGTAVLAALLPARSASRQDVVGALTGRRGTLRSSRAVPVVGVLAALAGAGIALYGAQRREVTVILAGSALAELGLVATTPTLVGLAGRLGPRLPVAPRLALRDAARNRGRTAPAVSAILAAVAGSVAVGTYVASLDRHDEQAYQPSAPRGTTVVAAYDEVERALLPSATRVVRRVLPDARVLTVRALQGLGSDAPDVAMQGTGYVGPGAAPERMCPAFSRATDALDLVERERLSREDPRCTSRTFSPQVGGGSALVGGADLVEAVTGHSDPAYAEVLAAGGAVVPWRSLRSDGTADIEVHPAPSAQGSEQPVRTVRVRAAALPAEGFAVAVLSPAAAATVGLPVVDTAVVAVGAVPTQAQEDALRSGIRDTGLGSTPVVERGYRSEYALGLLALVLGSAVIVLGASGIATGLAAADARADLSTLAAVGASPGVRRRLAAFQSAVTAGLGTLLGVVAGLVPAIGLLTALNRPPEGAPPGFARENPFPIVLPWESLAVTGVVVPLLAALAAAALTRSRLPLVRRAA